jgi:hypothetical protein
MNTLPGKQEITPPPPVTKPDIDHPSRQMNTKQSNGEDNQVNQRTLAPHFLSYLEERGHQDTVSIILQIIIVSSIFLGFSAHMCTLYSLYKSRSTKHRTAHTAYSTVYGMEQGIHRMLISGKSVIKLLGPSMQYHSILPSPSLFKLDKSLSQVNRRVAARASPQNQTHSNGRFLGGGMILGSPYPVPTYSYIQ